MQAIMFLAPDLIEEGACQMNFDDRNMLLSLLDWKAAAQAGSAKEITISLMALGPAEAKPVVREALAMGADRAVLLLDHENFSDPLNIALLLKQSAMEMGEFQLLCAGDHSGAHTAFLMAAELLNLPMVSQAASFSTVSGGFIVERTIPEGTELVFTPSGSFLTNCWKKETPGVISFSHIQAAISKELLIREVPAAPCCTLLTGTAQQQRKGLIQYFGKDEDARLQIRNALSAVCYSG